MCRRCDAVGTYDEVTERLSMEIQTWMKRQGVTDYMLNMRLCDGALVIMHGDERKLSYNLGCCIGETPETLLPFLVAAVKVGTGKSMRLVELDEDAPDASHQAQWMDNPVRHRK